MSCLNLNKVILAGRLTACPELKMTQSGTPVTSFTLAINRRFVKDQGQQQTDFITVVAWRQTAEFITKFFGKGSAICILGTIQTRSWQDQHGQKRYSTEVIADEAMFVDSKSDGSCAPSAYVPDAYAPAYAPADAPKFEEITPDDNLPF